MLELSVEQVFKRASFGFRKELGEVNGGRRRTCWHQRTGPAWHGLEGGVEAITAPFGTFWALMLIVGELWVIAIGFHWRSSGQTVLASKRVTVWVHELCLLPISLKQWLHSERLPLPLRFKSFYIFQQSSWVSILSIAHALEAVASRGCGRSAIEASFCWLQGEHKNAEVMQPCAVMCSKISWIMLQLAMIMSVSDLQCSHWSHQAAWDSFRPTVEATRQDCMKPHCSHAHHVLTFEPLRSFECLRVGQTFHFLKWCSICRQDLFDLYVTDQKATTPVFASITRESS